MTPVIYRFGEFRLDPAARELVHHDKLIVLPAIVFDCLVYLLEHRDRAVGRDELIAAVWGRTEVTDTLLGQTVLKVRRTLGDDGDTQHTVRTIPRFGYRWIADVETESAVPPASLSIPASTETPPQQPLRSLRAQLVGLGLSVLIVLATVLVWQMPGENARSHGSEEHPNLPSLTDGALVLPFRVDAPPDWSWLRLGLMDLVAERLQRADLATVPSESVVGLLRDRENDPSVLNQDPTLAHLATWRIHPEVRFDNGTWHVTLEAHSKRRRIGADSHAEDVVRAARAATDSLLLKLGRQPPPAGSEVPALDELMQRTRAAMLGDQFDLARALIRDAAPDLRERPELVHRLAQIELRAGHYEIVERLIVDLLPRLPIDQESILRGRALVTLGASYVRRNQADAAEKAYQEAIALLRGKHEPSSIGLAYLGSGLVSAMRGNLDAATAELGRARIEMQGAGDALGVAQVDLNLGVFDLMRQRPADALSQLNASAERFQTLGSQEELIYTLTRIVEAESSMLAHEKALATSDRFWPPEAHSGNERFHWDLTLARAHTLLRIGRLGDAQALIDRLQAEAHPELDASRLARAAGLAAQISFARGNVARAVDLASVALTPMLAKADIENYLTTWHVLLRSLRRLNRPGDAAAELARMLSWNAASQHEDDRIQLHCLLARAEQADYEKNWPAARAAYDEALNIAEKMNVPDDLVEVARSHTLALLAHGEIEQAQALAGRIAPWADMDLRAALVQAHVYKALNVPQAWQQASRRARDLAGEYQLPPDAILVDD